MILDGADDTIADQASYQWDWELEFQDSLPGKLVLMSATSRNYTKCRRSRRPFENN